MATNTEHRSIFRDESEDHAASLDIIDEYIRISGPGTHIIIAALLIVLVALIIWGLTGTLPVTETVAGVVDSTNNNSIVCFADASRFSPEGLMGKQASIHLSNKTSVNGVVEYVANTPMSEEAAIQLIDDDWLASNLVSANYSYLVSIKPEKDLSNFGYQLVEAFIITDEVRPIVFLLH